MGVWGTGVFQDDTACDVRDDYKDRLADGMSGPEATAKILADFKSLLDDPAESCAVWFALAATQWRCGRLEKETYERALELLDSGADLTRWDAGSRDFAKRKAVLEKLRLQISSPQPEAKRVRKQHVETCEWPVGALLAYRMSSGRLAVFHVVGHHTDKGGTSPTCRLLDWTGEQTPTIETLRETGVREGHAGFNHRIQQMILFRVTREVSKRIERLDSILEPQGRILPATAVSWKEIDVRLKDWFGME